MKIAQLVCLFLMTSCSVVVPKFSKGERDLASLFQQSRTKAKLTHTWSMGSEYIWLAKPSLFLISSIVIHDTEVKCNEENVVKVHEADRVVLYLTKGSKVRCKSEVLKDVKVDYTYFEYSLTNVASEQLQTIEKVLQNLETKNISKAMSDIKSLGLSDLFDKKMNLAELKSLSFKEGDFVELSIWPQMKKVKCPDGNCELQVDVFGLLDDEKMGLISGMNQLKYQQIPPFLFFCGSKFTAGNIYFRADEKTQFSHVVDENGFSCDINTFLLQNELDFEFRVKWISSEKIQSLLMGKREHFVQQKNIALKNQLSFFLDELGALNELRVHKEVSGVNQKKMKGHIELWWEPFDRCSSDAPECNQKELVMTRSRFVYDSEQKRLTNDFPLIPMGVKQVISADEEEDLIAFVVKICPEDLLPLLEEQLVNASSSMDQESFKENVLSYEGKSCRIKHNTEKGKGFEYRWLLASIPKEIEKEEVDLVIEDYQLLEKPSEQRMEKDPFKTGKLFFEIYLKNLKEREVLFKRSRIIEVLK